MASAVPRRPVTSSEKLEGQASWALSGFDGGQCGLHSGHGAADSFVRSNEIVDFDPGERAENRESLDSARDPESLDWTRDAELIEAPIEGPRAESGEERSRGRH
jgi:hypothetical protein